jgi:hypothetical protein
MTLTLQLIDTLLAVPAAIVALGAIRKRRADARSAPRTRRPREIDFSVRLRIRRK